MKIFPSTEMNINKAAAIIKSGGIVSFPTETVYGLGADAFNSNAVKRIFEVKNRPFFDPIIVHIHDMSQLEKIAVNICSKVKKLTEKFWPGPLTLILIKSESIPDIVTSGLSTVAVRMPDHKVAIELIKKSETAIAAPSANPFGYLSSTTAEHVLNQLGDKVDMILDGGKCSVGVESTIVKFDDKGNRLLRPGGVPVEEIESILGSINVSHELSETIEAPGSLPYHYSPVTPLEIVDDAGDIDFNNKDAAFLLFSIPDIEVSNERIEILSASGNMSEAAASLFSALHRLDKLKLKIIYAERVPEVGLGLAIMDRLRKASKKN